MQIALLVALWTAVVAVDGAQAAIHLTPQNDSHEFGTVTLHAQGNATRITVVVSGEPQGAVQPANIHLGNCDSVRQIGYTLHDVRNGRSTTTVPTSLTALSRAKYVIVVQDSPASLRAPKDYRYVSCGALP